jgi:hypothetical protein
VSALGIHEGYPWNSLEQTRITYGRAHVEMRPFSNQVPINFMLSSSFLMIHCKVGRLDSEEWRV